LAQALLLAGVFVTIAAILGVDSVQAQEPTLDNPHDNNPYATGATNKAEPETQKFVFVSWRDLSNWVGNALDALDRKYPLENQRQIQQMNELLRAEEQFSENIRKRNLGGIYDSAQELGKTAGNVINRFGWDTDFRFEQVGRSITRNGVEFSIVLQEIQRQSEQVQDRTGILELFNQLWFKTGQSPLPPVVPDPFNSTTPDWPHYDPPAQPTPVFPIITDWSHYEPPVVPTPIIPTSSDWPSYQPPVVPTPFIPTITEWPHYEPPVAPTPFIPSITDWPSNQPSAIPTPFIPTFSNP
jgi:hypothetical protein